MTLPAAAALAAADAEQTLEQSLQSSPWTPGQIHLTLKFAGVTFVPDTFLAALLAMVPGAGIPQLQGSPARNHYRLIYGAEQNLIPSANADFEVNTAGWGPTDGGVTISRTTTGANIFQGVGALSVVTNSGVANQGAGFALNPTPASQLYRGGAWVKGNVGGELVRVSIQELTTGGGFIGETNVDATLGTSYVWIPVERQFGNNGQARFRVVTQGTATVTFFVDNVVFGIDTLSPQWDSDVLNPDWSANPTIVTALLDLGQIPFWPKAVYAVLDQLYPTVTSDKDTLARGDYQFTISP